MNMRFLRFAALSALALPALVHAQVTVSEPWVRGTVPGQHTTGAFMKLKATENTALVGASSSIAGIVEVHESKMEGGTMKMRAIERLPIAKGKSVDLGPGGHHIMLIDLRKPVAAGDDVPIALVFEDAGGKRSTVNVVAKGRPLTQSPGSASHMKH